MIDDVQNDLLDGLDSRMVMPLRRLDRYPKVLLSTHLTPVFNIKGEEFLRETPKMGAVSGRVVKSPMTSLTRVQVQITGALDFCLASPFINS